MTRSSFAALIGLALFVVSCAPRSAPPPAATAVPVATAKPSSASAYTPTPLSPPVKVSIGVVSSSSDGGIFVANERGYFKDEGIDLDIQRFQTLVDMVAPLTGGQLQIAAGGLAPVSSTRPMAGLACPAGLDPDGKLDISSMKTDLNYYVESGQVKSTADLAKLIDTTFEEAAVKALGFLHALTISPNAGLRLAHRAGRSLR